MNSLRVKILLLVAFVFSVVTIHAQRKPKIKGNREVISIREDLPSFIALELEDDLDINLQRSRDPGYAITADDNLIDVLKFAVVDSTLVIRSFYRITTKKKLEITVYFDDLKSVKVKEGRIRSKDRISTESLEINTYGNARLDLNADTAVLTLDMQGNSSGKFNFESDSLHITLRDRIDTDIYAVSERNAVKMEKNAAVTISGNTGILDLEMRGNSIFRGQQLEAAEANVILTESPSARVNAYRDLTLTSQGSSKTFLYGNPRITINEFLDTSELLKRK